MPRTRAKANKVKSLPATFHLRKISENEIKAGTRAGNPRLPEQGLGMTGRHYQGGREGGSTDQYLGRVWNPEPV